MNEFEDEIKNDEPNDEQAENAEETVVNNEETTEAPAEETAGNQPETPEEQSEEAEIRPEAEEQVEPEEQPAGNEEIFEEKKEPEGIRVYAPTNTAADGDSQYGNTEKKEKKQVNSGAVIAILAAVTALAIIIACCALVVGMMLSKRLDPAMTPDTTSESSDHGHNTQPTPKDTEKSDTDPSVTETEATAPETDKPAPRPDTDPDATIAIGDSKNKYSMTEVAAMTVDSVVEIRTELIVPGSFMQQYVAKGAGSGVIVTQDGYIVTNNHVIDGATSITVVLRNGKIYEATLIGTDPVADIAIVKISETGLRPATFGSSEKLVVAESVIAIGNPLGSLGGSVTNGIISALARTVTIEDQEMTLMQTTAAINPGNSGGGLFNMSGECIGIVNAKSSGEDIEGIGFAIPSDTAVPIIEDLIRYGYVRGRVMLGVTMLEVNDSYTARRYGLSEFGVYIASVGSGSDAEKAGIKEKDKIVSINGKEINAYSEVKRMIQKFRAGETAEIVVKRDGSEITLHITFSEYIPK